MKLMKIYQILKKEECMTNLDIMDLKDLEVQGDLLEQCEEKADVIVANIIADVICYLCKPVSTKLEKDGIFIMSGIIREKEADVLNALERAGYAVCDRLMEGEWVCLAARMKG